MLKLCKNSRVYTTLTILFYGVAGVLLPHEPKKIRSAKATTSEIMRITGDTSSFFMLAHEEIECDKSPITPNKENPGMGTTPNALHIHPNKKQKSHRISI